MSGRTLLSHIILRPMSALYGFGTYVRNKMFDWQVFKQHKFDVPVVSVGNLAVGGTGKTPHTEYLISALRHSYHLAVMSRGYKRKTSGFILASRTSTPEEIGDEAYQMYHKFNGEIVVAVCEDRVAGIRELLRVDPAINLIILDDAFQHRYVKPTVNILVTEYSRPYFRDHLMPYGRLRESTRGSLRADIIVVSKCPDDLKQIDYSIFREDLNMIAYQKLYFSRISYLPLRPVFPESGAQAPSLSWLTAGDSVLAIAGIANPRPFLRYLKSFMAKVKVNIFPDHHAYTRKDMELIEKRYAMLRGAARIIVTTEKDAVRLAGNPYFPDKLKQVIFYLPVAVDIINRDEPPLEETVRRLIK